MSRFDITVAVTAHSETLEAGPAMRSAEFAINVAEAAGYSVEKLIGLDDPSSDCRTFFSQPAFAGWRISEFDFGDPYPTRNALVDRAAGRWIAFLDSDDLFSENWLMKAARLLDAAEAEKRRVIVHPELNWVFDGSTHIFTVPAQDDLLFTPYYFYFTNYYDMLCMAPREAYHEFRYAARDLKGGFGYGDQQWAVETMGGGWRHIVAPDTIIFKRRRDASVVLENAARKVLIYDVEPLSIDRIRPGLGRL